MGWLQPLLQTGTLIKSKKRNKEQQPASPATVTLYHQTSPEIARAILATGQMKPGSKGYGGGGIYFAAAPEITSCKATKKGVILECEVELGRIKEISSAGDWSGKLWRWLYVYDSVKITSIDDGVEWVVFDSGRVKKITLWNPGVGAELALLLLLAANMACLLQCVSLVAAQWLQQVGEVAGGPSSGRPSFRSLGTCSGAAV